MVGAMPPTMYLALCISVYVHDLCLALMLTGILLPLGLSQRADHPASQLHLLHGSLFDVKCTSFHCNYVREDFTDPIVPALEIPKAAPQPVPSAEDKTGEEAAKALYGAMGWSEPSPHTDLMTGELDISD